MRAGLWLSLCLFLQGISHAAALETSAGRVSVMEMMTGLDAPWAIGFLSDGGIVVTERGGRVLHRRSDGSVAAVRGGPKVVEDGQGGLLDVMVPRDFASTRELFFSYAKEQGADSGTALAVGRLDAAGERISNLRVIFEMTPGSSGGRHFGSRIVEAPDGALFLTIGERGDRPSAQDLARHNGSVIRINRDGSVPADNPFVNTDGAAPEIWSYGHRNQQGAALDSKGRLWTVEHGARGGDEVNRIERGANYGWPIISYGTHYDGGKIGEGTSRPGMEQPAFYWDPSMAPSGMMIYSGKLWPEWKGSIFIGSLKFGYISRLAGSPLRELEQIEAPETERVRDIREAPDGSIWFLSVGNGALYRMAPG